MLAGSVHPQDPWGRRAEDPFRGLRAGPVRTSPHFCRSAIFALLDRTPATTKSLELDQAAEACLREDQRRCGGCAGSPACVEYCPVENCMFRVYDEDNPSFGRVQIDPILCIDCKKCLSTDPDGCFLDGCRWDAIAMVDIAEVEKEVGPMTY